MDIMHKSTQNGSQTTTHTQMDTCSVLLITQVAFAHVLQLVKIKSKTKLFNPLEFCSRGKFFEFHSALLMGVANYGKGMMWDCSSQQSRPFFFCFNQHPYNKVCNFFSLQHHSQCLGCDKCGNCWFNLALLMGHASVVSSNVVEMGIRV